MYRKYPRKSLPSIRWGLFNYEKPFDREIKKEIKEIASKYSFSLVSYEVLGLNYLFTNHFMTLEQANMLAKQLVNWVGMYEKQKSKFFTDDHMDALIALIQDQQVRGVPIDEVVNNLQLLTRDQARRIANGLTREEAMTNLPFNDIDEVPSSKLNP
ncbi:hypothetical protein [Legionella tucsonensis]|uniref:Uncharacterized protein n=1 Tax=Legionella tucsonensis TaxID=40335 RepID=A0A0W0ZW70_9GAMM|nr:hypothetical protein [Legionella tucsonensis]KTD73397.1 hypothetical protein Ltuc_1244 [Legionella tucsonensis]